MLLKLILPLFLLTQVPTQHTHTYTPTHPPTHTHTHTTFTHKHTHTILTHTCTHMHAHTHTHSLNTHTHTHSLPGEPVSLVALSGHQYSRQAGIPGHSLHLYYWWEQPWWV